MMASCEARLLRQKVISGPFTAKEIAEGALWDHLTQEDYEAPLKVFTYDFNIFFFFFFFFFYESLATRWKTISKHLSPHSLLATRQWSSLILSLFISEKSVSGRPS